MALSKQQRSILMGSSYIKSMKENEELLSRLYLCFADAFPGQAKFWNSIAEDEARHKKIISAIEAKMKDGEMMFQRPAILYSSMIDSVEWTKNVIKRIEASGMTAQEAMQVAITAEKAMIEMNYMDVLEGDSPEAVKMLKVLKDESVVHLRKVEKEAERLKWRFFGKKVCKAATHTDLKVTDLTDAAKESQREILLCLISLEENLSMLYSTFCTKLPEHEVFWGKYSAEEKQHSAMLKTLFQTLEKGHLFGNIGVLNKEELVRLIELIMTETYRARMSRISMKDALKVALKMETMIAESSFYNNVTSTASEYQVICKHMTGLLAGHKKLLQDKMISFVTEKDRDPNS